MSDPIRFPTERTRAPMKTVMNAYHRNKEEAEAEEKERAFWKSVLIVVVLVVFLLMFVGGMAEASPVYKSMSYYDTKQSHEILYITLPSDGGVKKLCWYERTDAGRVPVCTDKADLP